MNDDFFRNIYYGTNEINSKFFVKQICENLGLLESSINLLNKEILDSDDLYYFLWSFSIKEVVKDIDHFDINNDIKKRLLELGKKIILQKSSYISFINSNFKDVFDEKKYPKNEWIILLKNNLDLCYGYFSNGINREVFNYLEHNFPLHILSDFEMCKSYYSSHKEGFKSLFSGLIATNLFDDQIYLSFLIRFGIANNDFLKDQANFICTRSLKAFQEMDLSENNKDIFQIQSLFSDYKKLSNLFRLSCAIEFNALSKIIGDSLDKFIRKNGVHKRIGPFDFSLIKKELVKSNDVFKFIGLTHKYSDNDKFTNILDSILDIKTEPDPLSNLFNDISRPSSKKYPLFIQDNMNILLWWCSTSLNMVFNSSELIEQFANYIDNVSNQVQCDYFNNAIDINTEIVGIVDSFGVIMDLAKQKKESTYYGMALICSLSMLVCSTIEKLFRNVALKEVKGKAFFDNKTTLSECLNNHFKLHDISDGVKYFVEFYLLKENNIQIPYDERPGLNIRNDLMHGSDDAFAKNNYEICLKLFYLLLSLIDDLLIASTKTNESKSK